MDLKKIMQIQREFDQRHPGFYVEITDDNIGELENLLVCLYGEAGEVSNLVKKIRRGDFALSSVKADLSEEIADVFIYLIKMCNQLHIDLEAEYVRKLRINEPRFRNFEA
ncbi:MAG: MazG nucleotide pyrophosphohydrolase domain-containing protein [Verrucomicrobiia bacterium]